MTDGGAVGFLVKLLLHPDEVGREALALIERVVREAAPIVVTLLGLAAGVWLASKLFIRLRDRRMTRSGRRIRILPPPSIPESGGLALWTALHGLIRPRLKRLLLGEPPIVWEVVARADDLEISLWVPESTSIDSVTRAIESAWPGSSLVKVESAIPFRDADRVKTCQLKLALPEWFPIGSGPDADPVRLVLASMGNLKDDEAAVLQMVATPIPSGRGEQLVRRFNKAVLGRRSGLFGWLSRRKPPVRPTIPNPSQDGDVRMVHAKAAAPLWECTLRLGVAAATRGEAKARVRLLATAFSMFEGRNGLRSRRAFLGAKKIKERRLGKGFLLSVQELSRLATFPLGMVAGLDAAGARILSPPRSLAREGRVLGVSNSGVEGKPVAISLGDGRHHLHILGETGTGKSTLIANLVLQDAAAGRAGVVIDPKGDLVEAILKRLPEGAEERTCLIDPTDVARSVGLNVLSGEDIDLMVDQLVSLFRRLYEHHWGPRSDDLLRGACLTLARIKGATLAEIPLLLTNPEWRREIRFRLTDPTIRHFWEQFDRKPEGKRQDDISPLMNKLRQFLFRPSIRTILGQARPKRDFEELIECGGIILVRIPKGLLGEDTSRLLGGIAIARVWQVAMRRASLPESARADIALYVDEMHNYMTLPRSFEDLLAEARGYGLTLVLAHQHLGQLDREVRDALEANARTKIVFACSPKDASGLEPHFKPLLTDYDLPRLPAYTAACRPCIEGSNGNPFTFTTVPLPEGSEQRAFEVRQRSAELFAVSRPKVEDEINRRQIRPEVFLLPEEASRPRDQSPDPSSEQSAEHSGERSSEIEPEEPDFPGEAA